MCSEKQPLIQTKNQQQKGAIGWSHRWRHTLILPMIVLFYLPVEVIHYIINEWIQQTVISQQFPNATHHQKSSPCEDKNKTDGTSNEYKHAERVTSQWLLYNTIAMIVPLIFVNMILPSYSDTYGRKFVFLISMVGLFMKEVIAAITIYFDLHVMFITIAYGIEGITGGSTAIFSMSFAYVADLTTGNSNRILGIVTLEAALLLAALCPAFIAAYMEASGLGYTLSAVVCASVLSVGLVILIFLPESLHKDNRVPRKTVLSTMKRTVDFYTSKEFKGQRTYYLLLLLAYAIGCVGTSNRNTTETLYFLNQPFCWNPITFGYFTLVKQASKAVFGTVTLRPLQMCMSSEVVLILATCSALASYIIEGLATTAVVVYVSSVVGSLSFLTKPLIRALMSTMAPVDKQGSLFASLSVIGELSSLISDFTTNLVYQATVSFMNSFVFLIMAVFVGLQVILLSAFWCKKPKLEHENDNSVINKT